MNKTIQEQREVLKEFLGQREMKAVRLPTRYELDWAVMSAGIEIDAWVECKRCSHARGTYPMYWVDLKKWQEGCELSRLGGMPFLIVVGFEDGIFYVRHDEVLGHVQYGVPRGRAGDHSEGAEPCALIPTYLFQSPSVVSP